MQSKKMPEQTQTQKQSNETQEKKVQVKKSVPQKVVRDNNSGSGENVSGRHLKVVATGYSLIGDSQGSDGDPYTASGSYPTVGRTIAVDPSVIPLGSTVYIPALGGTFKAEDTGGAINGNHIDVYMANGDIARQWGRKTLDIYVQ